MRLLLALPVLAAALYFAAGADATTAPYVYEVYMYGNNVVPSVNTQAYGFLRFFFNDDFTAADVTVDVKGFSGSAITGADIHAGKAGSNGPVVMHLTDGNFIVTSAHIKLTPSDLEHMMNGDWYGVVTTVYHPDGEMRGQIQVPALALGGVPATPTPATASTTPAAVTPAVPTPTRVPSGGGGAVISPPNTGDAGLLPTR